MYYLTLGTFPYERGLCYLSLIKLETLMFLKAGNLLIVCLAFKILYEKTFFVKSWERVGRHG